MVVLCELCGKEMETEVELQDGQHVVCPHCNGKSTYRKPALRVHQKVAPPAEAAMDAHRMFSRQLTVAEDHLRLLDKINDNESIRRKRETIGVGLVVLAVVLCVVGAYGYVGHRRERRRQAEAALAVERDRLEAERMEALRKARELREEKIREEEKRREERRQAENERIRLVRQQREERRQARDEVRDKERQDAVANELQRKKNALVYRKACALFKDGVYCAFEDLPSRLRSGKVLGETYFLLPFLGDGEIAVCQSSTNGIESVCRIEASGVRSPFEIDKFRSLLHGADYLLAHGGKVYVHSKKRSRDMVRLPKKKAVDLLSDYLGDIAPELRRLGIRPKELKFEIVFVFGEKRKSEVVDVLECGESYSPAGIKEVLARKVDRGVAARSAPASSDQNKPMPGQSVAFWDGAAIKHGSDGVVYVPRFFPKPVNRHANCKRIQCSVCKAYEQERRGYERWKVLRAEAARQVAEARRYQAELRKRQLSEYRDRKDSEFDKIYDSGNLYYRVKFDGR